MPFTRGAAVPALIADTISETDSGLARSHRKKDGKERVTMAMAFLETQLITSSPKFYLNFPALLSDTWQNKINKTVSLQQ